MIKKLSVESYYTNRNLRPWSVQEAIQERTNRESYAMEQDAPQNPPMGTVRALKKGIGLANFFKNTLLAFKP